MKILDSHVHFIDPARPEGLAWPAADSDNFRRLMPPDLTDASRPADLVGCIVVETSQRAVDDRWLLQLAAKYPEISAVVLNLQPDQQGFDARLSEALASDAFAGIRLRPIAHYDLDSPVLLDNIERLESLGKSIEFGAKTILHKTWFRELAERFPKTRWILDHCGHPEPGKPLPADWCDAMAAIAALPNTACKVSSNYHGWQELLDHLIANFGPGRLMYGSNWPVCSASVGLRDAMQYFLDAFGDGSGEFFGGNACRIYNLATAGAAGTCREFP